MIKNRFTTSLMLGILTASAVSSNSFASSERKMERCYGVVKAGHNDCGDKKGLHSCAAQATKDGSKDEWLLLRKGVCKKLVNGSLT